MRRCARHFAVVAATATALLAGCTEPQPETVPAGDDGPKFYDIHLIGGESGGAVVPHSANDLALAEDGRIAAVFGSSVPPLWFDSTGLILGEIGEFGEGPGEFGFPEQLLPIDDSMVVFDQRGGISVVPLRGGAPRTIRGSGVRIRDATVLEWPFRVVVSASPGGTTDSVPALMILDLSGPEATESEWLEMHHGEHRAETPSLRRIIAPDPRAGFWSIDRYQYRLVQWDSEGQIIRSMRRSEEWAPGGTVGLQGGPEVPPTPRMEDLFIDSIGRPWTITHLPKENWASVWRDYGTRHFAVGLVRSDLLTYQARTNCT